MVRLLAFSFPMQRSALDAEVRRSVNEKLEKSGEKERYVSSFTHSEDIRTLDVFEMKSITKCLSVRLKELLRLKLAESGWRDQLKEHCKVVPSRSMLPRRVILPRFSSIRLFFVKRGWMQSA